MLALVLVGALITHSSVGIPTGTSYNNYPNGDIDANIGSRKSLGGNAGNQEQNEIGTSVLGGSSATPNADWITYRPSQPSPASMPYSSSPALNVENDTTQQLEQLEDLQNLVTNFVTRFNQPEGTAVYKSNLNAAIDTIDRRINELSYEALQREPTRSRFQKIKNYFENIVTSIRLRLDYIEEEQRLEAEKEAERRRSEQVQSTTPSSASADVGYNSGSNPGYNPDSNTGYNPGSSSGSNSGSNSGYNPGSIPSYNPGYNPGSIPSYNPGYNPGYPNYRPSELLPIIPDMTAVALSLQQNLNRLQQEAFQLNRFRMRPNTFNLNTIVAEAELAVANLQNSINALSESSRRYQNTDVFMQTQDLKTYSEGLLRKLKTGL